jgi:DNA-binding NtrC family response regulator
VIGLGDLPATIQGPPTAPAASRPEEILSLREVQHRHILWVLEKAAGNRAQAARLLGTSERTFYRLLERYRRAASSTGASRDTRPTEREP